jgi:hypothetical protein
MKKILFGAAIILSLLNVSIASPAGDQAPTGVGAGFAVSRQSDESGDTAVTGKISDSHCRFKHMDGMESEETCVHHCLGNGAKIVLVDREKTAVYTLDEQGEKLARKFAAQRVRVSGHVMDNMIHVETIEAVQ